MSSGNRHRKKVISQTMQIKINALKKIENGTPINEIAKHFDVHRRTVKNWQKNKKQIMELEKNSEDKRSQKMKRIRKSDNELVDKATWMWFSERRSAGMSLSGTQICSQALFFHRKLGGINNFCASSGWLSRWKTRHGLRSDISSDDKKSVDEEDPDEIIIPELAQDVQQTNSFSDTISNHNETELRCSDASGKCELLLTKCKNEDGVKEKKNEPNGNVKKRIKRSGKRVASVNVTSEHTENSPSNCDNDELRRDESVAVVEWKKRAFIYDIKLEISFDAEKAQNYSAMIKSAVAVIVGNIIYKYRSWRAAARVITTDLIEKLFMALPNFMSGSGFKWETVVHVSGYHPGDEEKERADVIEHQLPVVYDRLSYVGYLTPEKSKYITCSDFYSMILNYTVTFFLNPALEVAKPFYQMKGFYLRPESIRIFYDFRDSISYEKDYDYSKMFHDSLIYIIKNSSHSTK